MALMMLMILFRWEQSIKAMLQMFRHHNMFTENYGNCRVCYVMLTNQYTPNVYPSDHYGPTALCRIKHIEKYLVKEGTAFIIVTLIKHHN